jgi:hypothetical protein
VPPQRAWRQDANFSEMLEKWIPGLAIRFDLSDAYP